MSECNICKENPEFSYNWDFWKTLRHSCEICGEDTANNHSGYFNAHLYCIKHTKYVNISYFMIPYVKKELGYMKLDQLVKMKPKCCVCDNNLTDYEIDNIKSTDANIYCNEHNEVRFSYSKEWSKLWFIYKQEVNPNAIAIKGSEDFNKCSEWIKINKIR